MAVRNPVDDVNVLGNLRDLDQRMEELSAKLESLRGAGDETQREFDKVKAEIHKLARKPNTLDFNDVFRGSGPTHAIGYVPDPGAASTDDAVLNSDGTWSRPLRGQVAPVTDNGELGDLDYPSDITQVNGSLAVLGQVSASGLSTDGGKVSIHGNRVADGDAVLHVVVPGTVGVGLEPDQISGLTGWWKADAGAYTDAGTTLATNGQTVQQWNDQSGAGRHFYQTTATNKPSYVTNVVNGNPVIRFDGNDNNMDTTAARTLFLGDSACTVFVIAYAHTADANSGTVYLDDVVFCDSGGGGARNCISYNTDPDISAFHYDGSEDIATKAQSAVGAWKSYLFMRGSGNVYIGVNDAQTASLTSAATGSTAALSQVLRIGANATATKYAQIDIAEMITYNVALSEADRKEVETYLAVKYNVSLGYTTTQYGDADILSIEDDSGNSVLKLDKLGNLYVKGVQVN